MTNDKYRSWQFISVYELDSNTPDVCRDAAEASCLSAANGWERVRDNATLDASLSDYFFAIVCANYPGLMVNMANGNAWNFNSKNGGVQLLYDEKYAGNGMYNNDINNIIENIAFFETNKPDYVVVAPAHIINTMDFSELVEAHAASGNAVTIATQKVKNADEKWIGCDYVKLDSDTKLVTQLETNMGNAKNRMISLETYVFSAKAFATFLKNAEKVSPFYSIRDMLAYSLDERRIGIYEYKGYVRCINNYQAYFDVCLEFLNYEVSTQVFHTNWPIFTNTNDTPPTKYKEHASVRDSMIANGAVVNGTVEHSIIGRDVIVGEGAVIKNSIIFSGSVIDPGSVLENVIMDKHARVKNMKNLKGELKEPLFIKEGDVV